MRIIKNSLRFFKVLTHTTKYKTMKPIKFLPIVMIAAAGLVASCSTPKLAQNSTSDDVYNTVAKAREVEYVAPRPQQQQQQGDQYQTDYNDEYYGTSNPYYDMDYSSRINRFYNGYSWQGYYDPYFDNYYYNNNYLGYGLGAYNGYGLGLGWNSGFGWNAGFGWGGGFYGNGWGYPGGYGWNSWGPYSYYDRFGWGGGWYGGGWGVGGGYYGGGIYTNRTNYHRPSYTDRNTVNANGYYPNGSGSRAGVNSNNGRPSRVSNNGTVNNGIINNGVNYGRPSRVDGRPVGNNGNNTYQQRPSREYMPQQQPSRTEQRPSRDYVPQQPSRTESRPSYSPPASSYGGGQSSGGGGGGRPSRSGRN